MKPSEHIFASLTVALMSGYIYTLTGDRYWLAMLVVGALAVSQYLILHLLRSRNIEEEEEEEE